MALRSNLIVNYFPNTLSDESFKAMFAPFGTMTNCKVIKDRQSGQSMGFGFVKFSADEEAANAIKALNGKDFGTKIMKVSIARPEGSTEMKNEIYTCNLPNTLGKSEIENLFKSYGEVIEVKIFKDVAGNSRGIACVQMGTAEGALKAIAELHNSNQGGSKPLVAKLWENKRKNPDSRDFQQPQFPQYPHHQQPQYPPHQPQYPHQSPYAQPYPPQATGYPPQDDPGGYGPIRKAQRFDANGRPVHDRPAASPYGRAPRATEEMPHQGGGGEPAYPQAPQFPGGAAYPGQPYGQPTPSNPYAASAQYSAYAQPGAYPPSAYPQPGGAYPQQGAPQNGSYAPFQHQNGGMNRGGGGGGGRPESAPSPSLFIFHVPRTMTEELLTQLFEPFAVKGSLLKVSVIKKPDGEPKGFAFVDFESIDDASAAVEKMNGHSVDGKYLKVSFKN